MKPLALILLGFAAMTGLVATLDDRETLVPPPDAIAEGFFRAVVNQRYAVAREYLEEPVPLATLRSLQQSIYYQCAGDVHDVQCELVSRTEEQALVTARLKSDQGSTAINVQLVWAGGEWKVKALPTT